MITLQKHSRHSEELVQKWSTTAPLTGSLTETVKQEECRRLLDYTPPLGNYYNGGVRDTTLTVQEPEQTQNNMMIRVPVLLVKTITDT